MSIEDRYLSGLIAVQYPEPTDTTSIDGMQLAAGPSGTVSDAGNGMGAVRRVGRGGVPYRPPSMRDITEPAGAMLDMGAATVKGATQGFLGLPGDLEGIGRLLLEKMGVGVDQNTVLPKTEEVKKWLDTNVGQVGNGQNPYETIGEVTAPGGQIKALKAAGRGAKALAPKAGEMVIDSMGKLGSPVKMNMMPDGPALAPKPEAPVNDLGFYSAVEQAALNVQRKSGSGQAFLNDITKGENVKADEVKWIGLDEFLKGKKSVTKQEVQDYIAANKVDVQEVTLGGAVSKYPYKTFDEWKNAYTEAKQAGNEALASDINTNWRQVQGTLPPDNKTKFDKYTLPGGENYREILLTTPSNMGEYNNYVKQLRAKYGEGGLANLPLTEIERARLDKFYANEDTQPFKSSHWEQPNVLAHIRVNDRVDADGKKMLLVEEVQSDWHQAGRDKGYKNEVELEAKFAPLAQEHRAIVERRAEIVAKPGMEEEYKSLAKREQQLIDEMNKLHDTKQYGVPDAPMKDTWYQLALKRVLKYAADNGYERVGLTTGSRQAERFDLSKQVERIISTKEEGGFRIFARDTNGKNHDMGVFNENGLSEVVGKDLAKKIAAQNKDTEVFEGVDLQVGGEGMKKYYDEIYPTYLQKYGKKWGAKVGETTVEADGKEPVRFVDITPEMRKSVGKGQPLFSAAAAGTGAAATMQDKEKN